MLRFLCTAKSMTTNKPKPILSTCSGVLSGTTKLEGPVLENELRTHVLQVDSSLAAFPVAEARHRRAASAIAVAGAPP